MKILMDEYRKRSGISDIDITNICGRLQQQKKQKPITNKEEKLKLHLEAFNRHILIKKGQKFCRDKNAFKDGKTYKWTQNKHIYNKRNPNQIQHSTSSQQTSNQPPLHAQLPPKQKNTQSTKHQYHSDPSEGQLAKTFNTSYTSSRFPLSHVTKSYIYSTQNEFSY